MGGVKAEGLERGFGLGAEKGGGARRRSWEEGGNAELGLRGFGTAIPKISQG